MSDEAVYVRFVRQVNTGTGAYELLHSARMPVWALPRKDEWVNLKLEGDLGHNMQVDKITTFYTSTRMRGSGPCQANVDHIEVQVSDV
jgi:hypothetical protein